MARMTVQAIRNFGKYQEGDIFTISSNHGRALIAIKRVVLIADVVEPRQEYQTRELEPQLNTELKPRRRRRKADDNEA